MSQQPILQTKNLGITFGGLKAVSGFDLTLNPGELVGLIGPNGAGKTTVFNLLTGVYRPTDGEIFLSGKQMKAKRPDQLVALGIARTFQNIRLFKELTVLDNVLIAFNFQMRYSVAGAMLRSKKFWQEEAQMKQKALELLELFSLSDLAYEPADSLPYGQQRKLEIARALATGPQLLLLDEPAAGMNHTETNELMDTISLIRKQFSMTILLIEHDMNLVLGICERLVVLDYGQIIATGLPQEVVNNKQVIAAYLGADD